MGCEWGAWGDCGGGECSPGETNSGGACGFCGTEALSCGDDCQWKVTACEGQGECAASVAETKACGLCGETARSCSATCGWNDWTPWSGEGECPAGSVDVVVAGHGTIVSIEGEIALGGPITLTSTLDPKRKFKLKVKALVKDERLVWGDVMGRRTFTLTPRPGRVRFAMHEKIGGPISPSSPA